MFLAAKWVFKMNYPKASGLSEANKTKRKKRMENHEGITWAEATGCNRIQSEFKWNCLLRSISMNFSHFDPFNYLRIIHTWFVDSMFVLYFANVGAGIAMRLKNIDWRPLTEEHHVNFSIANQTNQSDSYFRINQARLSSQDMFRFVGEIPKVSIHICSFQSRHSTFLRISTKCHHFHQFKTKHSSPSNPYEWFIVEKKINWQQITKFSPITSLLQNKKKLT